MEARSIRAFGVLFSCLLAGFLLVSSGALAASKSQMRALRAATDLCLDLRQTPQDPEVALVAGGRITASDGQVTIDTLASIRFALKMNKDDLAGTIKSTVLDVVSILGNSPLAPDRPGFALEDPRLAVVGLKDGTPHCALSGPGRVQMAAMGGTDTGMKAGLAFRHSPLSLWMGNHGDNIFAVSLLDKKDLPAVPQSGSDGELDDQNRRYFEDVVGDVNMIIHPFEPEETR